MADSTSGNLTLPEFQKGNSYILKGETLTDIMNVIKENKIVLTGSLSFDEVGAEGSKLRIDELPLSVCVNGQTQVRIFLVLGAGTQPPEE